MEGVCGGALRTQFPKPFNCTLKHHPAIPTSYWWRALTAGTLSLAGAYMLETMVEVCSDSTAEMATRRAQHFKPMKSERRMLLGMDVCAADGWPAAGWWQSHHQ